MKSKNQSFFNQKLSEPKKVATRASMEIKNRRHSLYGTSSHYDSIMSPGAADSSIGLQGLGSKTLNQGGYGGGSNSK